MCMYVCVVCILLFPTLPFSFFVDISLVQDDEVGDGTTSVAVLACELLKVRDWNCVYGLWLWVCMHMCTCIMVCNYM